MDSSEVPDSWVGIKVVFIPYDDNGRSLTELRGWLRSKSEEGIEFVRAHYVERAEKDRPKAPEFYPWSHVGHLEPWIDQD